MVAFLHGVKVGWKSVIKFELKGRQGQEAIGLALKKRYWKE